MDVLQKLGAALGFATLAGLNLYLTVFATGLAIHYHWIDLSATYPDLQVLGHPVVLVVAGVLFAVEFFADKVPWLDSAWDGLHTLIRPAGGAFLALQTLGPQHEPVVNVVIALLAGGVTLTTHGAKAGTRLLVNGSPEPFSNVAVSLGEDAARSRAASGLMAYSYRHAPYLSLGVFATVVVVLLYVTPRIFRFARIRIWLLWKKLSWPAFDAKSSVPTAVLPPDPELLFARLNPTGDPRRLGGSLPDGIVEGRVADELSRASRGLADAAGSTAFRRPARLAQVGAGGGSRRLPGVARITLPERGSHHPGRGEAHAPRFSFSTARRPHWSNI